MQGSGLLRPGDLGLRWVRGSGLRGLGLGLGSRGLGFRGLGFRGLGFRVWRSGVSDFFAVGAETSKVLVSREALKAKLGVLGAGFQVPPICSKVSTCPLLFKISNPKLFRFV